MAANYERGKTLGEGTFAVVYDGFRKIDGRPVAIKRMKGQSSASVTIGVDFTGLREVKYLRLLRGSSPHIVELLDTFLSGDVLCLVLEFCPYDLEAVIYDKSILLQTVHCKCYLQMLLRGIAEMHDRYILHRDLKPANLLIASDGTLKLADFGFARYCSSPMKMTDEVATRWYRPPELLFGARHYSSAVDVWSCGCIFAEVILRTPLFPGESDLAQLAKIFNVLGTPTKDGWPTVHLLPNYVEFEPRGRMDLSLLFQHAPALDLLLRMLELNPLKRITARDALVHPYFSLAPAPCKPDELQLPTRKGADGEEPANPPAKRPKVG